MNKRVEESGFYYLVAYLAVLHLIPFLNMFLYKERLRPYIYFDVVALLSIYYFFVYLYERAVLYNLRFTVLDLFVVWYIAYSVFSMVFYFDGDNPSTILGYAYGIHHLIIPIFVYFTVKLVSHLKQYSILKFICILNFFFVCVGFITYFLRPDFYTNFLLEYYRESGFTEIGQIYARMLSYYGSTAVGNIAGVTIVLLSVVKTNRFFKAVIFVSMVIAALLSQQRSGIFIMLVAVIFYMFFATREDFIVIGLAFAISISLFIVVKNYFFTPEIRDLIGFSREKIIYDLVYGNPFSERKLSYIKGLDVLKNFPFGLGIGATTSAADSGGANPGGQVVDANFMRILADLGIIGVLSFTFIIIISLYSALSSQNQGVWILIVFFYCVQMIGTNILDVSYISHTFWLFLGIIDSDILPNKKRDLVL